MPDRKVKNLVDSYNPESLVGTEFRRLTHNLLSSPLLPDQAKTFLITSSTVGEGKSTIASYLALMAAIHKSKKTLLIDADLRRPVLHKLFGLEQTNGICEIITKKLKTEDGFKRTSVDNLFVLTAGRQHPNPTELFDSRALPEFIEAVKFYFELIIIDCAPVMPVSDPLILGTAVDGVCLVVKAGVTQREVVGRACQLISQAGATLLGVVLNNMKEALPYFYGNKYYGYHYYHQAGQ